MSDGERETKPFKFVTGKLLAPYIFFGGNGLIANFDQLVDTTHHLPLYLAD
jgi:hypothetical protein